MNYRREEEFIEFVDYNDIGLPLAYAFANDIAIQTEIGERYINETYELLAEAVGVSEKEEFDSFESMLAQSTNRDAWVDVDNDDDDDDDDEQSPASTESRFCSNCGTSRRGMAKFCTNCGEAMA
jgi:membrane protease subunit (stomatin/prohibitin family)